MNKVFIDLTKVKIGRRKGMDFEITRTFTKKEVNNLCGRMKMGLSLSPSLRARYRNEILKGNYDFSSVVVKTNDLGEVINGGEFLDAARIAMRHNQTIDFILVSEVNELEVFKRLGGYKLSEGLALLGVSDSVEIAKLCRHGIKEGHLVRNYNKATYKKLDAQLALEIYQHFQADFEEIVAAYKTIPSSFYNKVIKRTQVLIAMLHKKFKENYSASDLIKYASNIQTDLKLEFTIKTEITLLSQMKGYRRIIEELVLIH